MTSFRCIALVLACLLGLAAPALADDGYDLWLRYTKVEARLLAPYRAANTVLVTGAASPTLDAARDELVRGLSGLLGRPLASGAVAEGALVIGTPKSSPLAAALNLDLAGAGEEGFVIRGAAAQGHKVI